MRPVTHHEIRLARRPRGGPTPDTFEIAETTLPAPGPGQLLVRNRLMSVTAVTRTLLDAGEQGDLPMPPYAVGEPLWGPALGEVVAVGGPGRGDGPAVGELVHHYRGWREYALVEAGEAERLPTEGPQALPDPAARLGQGFPAWLGVVRGAQVREGDTVFVSGAAGGVGSLAGQFARRYGAARVIGSCGSPRRAEALVKELGYDAAVVRGAGPVEDQLREAAPDGVDAVFDNVGGEQLEAALRLARPGARVAVVGSLARQLGDAPPVRLDTFALLSRGVTVRGLPASAHRDALPRFRKEFAAGLRDGSLTVPYTVLKGIEQAPRALTELLEGRHIGAVLVEL
ncbi:MDR family NADP-dependent oxidoreductase [Streptomyces albus]|uniref:MDR family NADP-dependent oxidoreductase n=1 Tax=Streptomyces albus TaxID=1888 RepID=UPI0006E2757D|nr:NADP-dependent oxidoreductase [Streptomyces albus]